MKKVENQGQQSCIDCCRRILIVDDNKDIHIDFKKILQSNSQSSKKIELDSLYDELFSQKTDTTKKNNTPQITYHIDDAYQGEESIAMVDLAAKENKPYSLIFMDVRMPPGIDGIQTVKQIWEKHPQLEVVLCTAYSDYSWEELIALFGETDHLLFIRKPFDLVAVKQVTLTLTKKWDLNRINRSYMVDLEKQVDERTENLTKVVQKLNEKNKQIVDVTHMITHDLRTPLSAIINTFEILHYDLPQFSDSSQELIKQSSDLAKYMENLIDDLMELAQMDNEGINISKSEVNITSMSKKIIVQLQSKLKEKGIEIENSITHTVFTDPKAMYKIFMNLIGNAINYIGNPENPKIILNSKAEKQGICISIQDNGIGIPKKYTIKIFEKFQRGEHSGSIKGTGLGLAIVKGLVDAHNGKIWFESKENHGTTFYLFFPYE